MSFLINSLTILAIVIKLTIFVSSATINCNYDGSYPAYTCNADTVDSVTYENQDITVTGTHTAGQNADNLGHLYFKENDVLNFIPTKIFDTFTNLVEIVIYNAQVETMTTNAFTQCSKLHYLDIATNSFPILPASFAESCTNLVMLLLYNDGIETIDKDAFKGLVHLEHMQIIYNKITYIEPGTLQYLTSLNYLMLSANQISTIHPDTFSGLTNLTHIELDHNPIKTLNALNLIGTPILNYITFFQDNISFIDPKFNESFPGIGKVTWQLNLNSNECIDDYFSDQKPMTSETNAQLAVCYDNFINPKVSTTAATTIPPPTTTLGSGSISASCAEHKDCRYFLDQNKRYTCVLENVDLLLTSIGGDHDPGFTDDDVKDVFFEDSFLSKVPRVIFDKFINLEFLSIKATGMTIINDHTFEVCGSNLIKLDASYNQISEITEKSLEKCQQLEWLDLTGSPVGDLNSEIFTIDKNLKHVIMNRKIPLLP